MWPRSIVTWDGQGGPVVTGQELGLSSSRVAHWYTFCCCVTYSDLRTREFWLMVQREKSHNSGEYLSSLAFLTSPHKLGSSGRGNFSGENASISLAYR